jgi:SPP1 family predicted phage head-tail adaptor
MPIQAGALDREIVIQTDTVTQSGTGEPSHSWATLATVWAQKVERGGREFHQAQQLSAETQAVFRIRHRTDVAPGLERVSYNSMTWDILHVMEVGRREALDLLCKAQQAT